MNVIKNIRIRGLDKEWIFLKIPLICFWFGIFRHILSKNYKVPIPSGICKIVNCANLIEGHGLFFMIVASSLLCIMYLLDFKMKWTTLGLFSLSVIVFTSEDSSGILNRIGTFSFIFLAQSFAYWINGSNLLKLKYSRIQYSIQAVVVGYFLSGCSKLLDSGLSWPSDGSRITLQVLKSFYYHYYTTLDSTELVKAYEIVQFLTESQNILVVLLAGSLTLELFALTAAVNKSYARFYGIALLLMHIGIYYFMDILIVSFAVPMVFVMINPFYLAVFLYDKMLKKPTFPHTLKSM